MEKTGRGESKEKECDECDEREGKGGLTFLHGISETPSLLTHRTTDASIIFCWTLQCLTNIATGDDDMRLRTAIICFGLTGLGTGASSETSTARLHVMSAPTPAPSSCVTQGCTTSGVELAGDGRGLEIGEEGRRGHTDMHQEHAGHHHSYPPYGWLLVR